VDLVKDKVRDMYRVTYRAKVKDVKDMVKIEDRDSDKVMVKDKDRVMDKVMVKVKEPH